MNRIFASSDQNQPEDMHTEEQEEETSQEHQVFWFLVYYTCNFC